MIRAGVLLLVSAGCHPDPASDDADPGSTPPTDTPGDDDDDDDDDETGDTDETAGTPTGDTADTDTTIAEEDPRIFVNEICASNTLGATDELGGFPDWIELYNPGPDDFPLAGLTITDDPEEPEKHALDASLVVPAGGWLLLYADGHPDEGPAHVSFELSSEGEEVALYDGGVLLSEVVFGALLTDTSMARIEDGGADFVVTPTPTPGATNGAPAATLGPVAAAPDGRCVPSLTAVNAWPLEGDTVDLALGCETGEDPLTGSVLSWTVGPTLAGATVTWSTGPADAGKVEVLVVLDGPGVPETVFGTAWIADDWRNPQNVPVDPLTYTEEFGLPVLHLDPAAAPTEEYGPADAWFDGDVYTATMKVRGAASAGYPKKSFTLEFEPDQIDLDDIGMGNKDHLVLISNFDDSAYVRQKLVFDTWAEMATVAQEVRLTPRTGFVVVYLDGVYHGLYTAADHVDDEFVKEFGFDDTGNLYKSVSHDANFYLTNASGLPKWNLHEGWEKKEGLPEDDFADLDALTAFTGSTDLATFDAQIDSWVVRTEFMDWLALVHWFAADDSGGKNAYLYHDPTTGLFRYVPWDFNQALGQNWYTARVDSTVYNDFVWTNRVFLQFLSDPVMTDTTWGRLTDYTAAGGPLDPVVLQAKVDSYYAVVEPSAVRDWDRWEDEYWGYFGWARADRNGFDEERAYMEQWIVDRAAYMGTVHVP